MPAIPCPIPLPHALRDEDAAAVQRNLFCPNYDGCLEIAVKRGWEGWSCARCELRSVRLGQPVAKDYAHARPRAYEMP